MKLAHQQEQEKNKCIKKLRRNQTFETINRLLCYACVIPFFHMTACFSQKKEIPVISTVGSVGFVVSIANAIQLKNKQEKLTEKLTKLRELERH